MLTSIALEVLSQVPPLVSLDAEPPETFGSMVLKYVVTPAIPVVLGLVSWALKALATFLKTKSETNKAAHVALVFGEMAQSIVADLEVTLRPQLQKALADGKLSPEEGAKLKAEALRVLKEKAPPQLLAAAGGIFGPMVDTWLSGLVERANTNVNPAPGAEAPKNP